MLQVLARHQVGCSSHLAHHDRFSLHQVVGSLLNDGGLLTQGYGHLERVAGVGHHGWPGAGGQVRRPAWVRWPGMIHFRYDRWQRIVYLEAWGDLWGENPSIFHLCFLEINITFDLNCLLYHWLSLSHAVMYHTVNKRYTMNINQSSKIIKLCDNVLKSLFTLLSYISLFSCSSLFSASLLLLMFTSVSWSGSGWTCASISSSSLMCRSRSMKPTLMRRGREHLEL